MTTGQILDVIADKQWWQRVLNGTEKITRSYTPEEYEATRQRLAEKAKRRGWL